jgi:tetratricopeptide (TPR) repeat protein
MTRWLVAFSLAALLTVAAGYLILLNSQPVTVQHLPGHSITAPLATVLLAAFAAGAILVALIASLRAIVRGWRAWQRRRHGRREARHAAATARAQDLVWKGDYAQARAEILRAEGDVPGEMPRLVLLAETHLHEGDPAAARRILEHGIVHIGPDPRLLDLLAEAAERTGDLRAAASALERARQLLPDSPRLARHLRDVYVAAGRWTEALEVQSHFLLGIRSAEALAVERATLRGLRYQGALAEAEPRRAVRLLAALAREYPDFLPAWVSAGDMLATSGRRTAARRLWERGARHRASTVLLERVAQLNQGDGKPERTLRLCGRLARRHPESIGLALFTARLHVQQGALDEAAAVLDGLPAAVKDQPLVEALWGEIHRRRGNHDLAVESLASACRADRVTAPFRCGDCRRPAALWKARCDGCGRWGTLASEADTVTPA